jgi:hypothetical protein
MHVGTSWEALAAANKFDRMRRVVVRVLTVDPALSRTSSESSWVEGPWEDCNPGNAIALEEAFHHLEPADAPRLSPHLSTTF